MNEPIERVDFRGGEPPVTHPGLMPFVAAARSQPMPRLRLDASTIHAAWTERRGRRRRTLGIAVAASIAAVALAGVLGRGTSRDDRSAPVVAATSEPAPVAAEPAALPADVPAEAPRVAIQLAPAVHLEPAVGVDAADYDVTGAWALTMRGGGLRVELDDDADEPLVVDLPEGALEIRTGVTILEVAGDVARITVESGLAVRIEADGSRKEMRPERASANAHAKSASELAALAEERLAAGDRAAAIRHLRTLVKRYPRSAPARTGLVDLARLLKAAGRTDEARCAYRLWLDRNPRSALRGEVERAAAGLGEGSCRGLSPR